MNKKIIGLAAAAALLGAAAAAYNANNATAQDSAEKEKCYGVAKAGKNDCGNDHHSCAGHSDADASAGEWVFVPKGLCDKLANGSTEPAAAAAE